MSVEELQELDELHELHEIQEMPESSQERMTCACGANILSRCYRSHCSNKKHKFLTGQISKEDYEEYEIKHKARYKNLDETKKQAHRDKAREYQRARTEATNGEYYEKQRLNTIVCQCGATINKTYSKSHMKSQKHLHLIAKTVPPKRTIVRKPKTDILLSMAKMIE